MTGYVVGAEAEADLNAIWDYIAEDRVDAADRWINRLFQAFDHSGQTPGMGHLRKDQTKLPVLFWAVDNYLVVYRVETPGIPLEAASIEIVAVTEGSRDIPSFLSRVNR